MYKYTYIHIYCDHLLYFDIALLLFSPDCLIIYDIHILYLFTCFTCIFHMTINLYLIFINLY